MVLVALLAVAATVVGLAVLWPHGKVARPRAITSQKTLAAKIVSVVRTRCTIAGVAGCRTVRAKLTEGPDRGRTTTLLIAGTTGFGALASGDRIRVFKTPAPPQGSPPAVTKLPPYSFADFDRRGPMLWLALGFAVLLVATGRLNGLRALVGLVASLLILVEFLIPAILHRHPALRFRQLFTGALDVGHDHIAATVNTLVFAYAGASLPVLLIFSIGGTTFTDAINSESVAEEVVATLIGSIGLIASMPITTAIAALLALRLRGRELGEAHAHVH